MTCKYERFFVEILRLKSVNEAPTKQHEIYFNEINKFKKHLLILTPQQVIGYLSLDKQYTQSDLELMEEDKILFSVTQTSEKSNRGYPAFQFDAGGVRPVIARILKILGGDYKNWDLAFWFNSFNYDLDMSLIEALDTVPLEQILKEVDKEKNLYQ